MNNPHDFDERLYNKAKDHVEKGVKAMWKSGADISKIEYAVASGMEDAGLLSVNVLISVKEKK